MLIAANEKNNETFREFHFVSINKELYNSFLETNKNRNGGRPFMRLK